jgi:transcription elongation factor Elf1
MRSTDTFQRGGRLMTDVIINLPFPCPHCGEEVSGEVGRLITNRQALCGFCGQTIDLVGEKMIAVIDKAHEAIARARTDGDAGQ